MARARHLPLPDAPTVFFPLAAVHAAVFVPLGLFTAGAGTEPLTPASPTGHGLELLAGFLLAALAGFLFPRLAPMPLLAATVLWLAGRIGIWSATEAGAVVAAAFPVLVTLLVAPRFAAGGRQWRNRLFALLLAGLGACLAAATLAGPVLPGHWRGNLVTAALMLAGGAILYLGGRLLAPAVANAWQGLAGTRETRLQPNLEALMLGGLVLLVLALPAGAPWTAPGAALAGIAAGIRVIRWRPWRMRHQPDTQGLALGYAWSAAGFLALALAWITPLPAADVIHILALGGTGTFLLHLMARTALQRARQGVAGIRLLPAASAMLAAATVLRLVATPSFGGLHGLLPVAVGLWSLSFVMLARLLVNLSRQQWQGLLANLGRG
ncbi:NnrS family protein [Arhodomonas sp. SL1]|uniref:NnrS family protein n=1 Tax=Arhodomonas sp. SL1 TaxID=3425691 RepID=UPI003F8813BD